MKSLPVYLPENAIAALTEIGGFIAETSGSVEAAMAFVDRIERRCHRIGDVPRGGIARPDLGDGIRMVPFERSAVILYRLTDDAVEIVNVFYGGRDYQAIIGGE